MLSQRMLLILMLLLYSFPVASTSADVAFVRWYSVTVIIDDDCDSNYDSFHYKLLPHVPGVSASDIYLSGRDVFSSLLKCSIKKMM